MSDGLLLEGTGLTKVYPFGRGEVSALRGVDIQLGRGELVAITGSSGCGKSTLLNVLGGLDTPTGGRVALHGRSVEHLGQREWSIVRRRSFGFVFQDFNLLPDLTAQENVALPALLIGSRRDARARARDLLDRLGLRELRDRLPHRLSGGEQQRVAIARALVNDPDVLLADEPTGNLDSTTTAEVIALFDELRDLTRGVLLVTHDLTVAACADRIVAMEDGRVVGAATGVG